MSERRAASLLPVVSALLPWLVGAAAVAVQFRRVLADGFDLTLAGVGDGRLVAYTLEHGWRWLASIAPHERFWDAPLFYPQANVSAYTDPMLGFGPLLWPWRLLGAAPDTAFQLWMLSVHAANYAAAYALLRAGVRLGRPAAVAGALVGATLSVRWLHHPQLFPFFPAFLGLTGLLLAFDAGRSRRHRRLGIVLLFASGLVQGWGAIYPLFYFGLLGALALGVALLTPSLRSVLGAELWRERRAWIGTGVLAALCFAPVLWHLGLTAESHGMRRYDPDDPPPLWAWAVLDSVDFVHGWLRTRLATGEHYASGAGILALALAGAGLWRERRRALVRLLAPATLAMVLLGASYGGWSPWRYVHAWVPGAGALRAHDRVTMILVPFVVVGMGLLGQTLLRRRAGGLVLVVLTGLAVAETWERVGLRLKAQYRARVADVAARVDPTAAAFYLYSTESDTRGVAEDASWASLATGKPTVNGRYGHFPVGFGLLSKPRLGDRWRDVVVTREGLEEALAEWLARHGRSGERVQMIEYTPEPWGRPPR